MAEVQEENKSSSGIKLFGATISLKPRSEDHEDAKKIDPTPEKRPDKIIPCPRCKCMETKFCYFNNYNFNQPRHFCKGCQRYWTAGGALRNVPVGAGRRKTKPPCGGLALPDGCLFDASGMQHLDFDEAVGGWQVAENGGRRQIFQAKRMRCASNSQSY